MYSALTYPLDVIKTNRILQTTLSKEGAESIPKEFLVLYEKGGLNRGLFRGFIAGLICSAVQTKCDIGINKLPWGLAGIFATFITNPF